MQTILDVNIPHHFWGDLNEARSAAQREAANTGAAVVSIDAVEVRARFVRFIGSMPAGAAEQNVPRASRHVDPGSFHTTWGAVLNPRELIGFLVIPRPIAEELCSPPDADNHVRFEVAIERSCGSAPVAVLGHTCCRGCKQPISPERLRARPNTQFCTACQSKKEEEANGNQRACR